MGLFAFVSVFGFLFTAGGIIPDEIGSFHPIEFGQHVQYAKGGDVRVGQVQSEYTCLKDGVPVVNVQGSDGTSMVRVSVLTIDLNFDPNDNGGIINFNYDQNECGGNSIPIWKSPTRNAKILIRKDKQCDVFALTNRNRCVKVRFIRAIDGTDKCQIKWNNQEHIAKPRDLFAAPK